MVSKAWDNSRLILERRAVVDGVVEMSGRLAAVGAICLGCATPSASFHRRYDRMLSDLPISGNIVRLRLSVRRFRCADTLCPRRTFSEPLAPPIGRRYGREGGPLRCLGACGCCHAGWQARRADDGAIGGAVVARHDAGCSATYRVLGCFPAASAGDRHGRFRLASRAQLRQHCCGSRAPAGHRPATRSPGSARIRRSRSSAGTADQVTVPRPARRRPKRSRRPTAGTCSRMLRLPSLPRRARRCIVYAGR
jgi:hypothetical protein